MEEAPERERRGDRTRRRIFAAAEEVFGRNGYHGASIEDIVREAEVGLGTFYVYFQSKLEAFSFIVSTRRAQWAEATFLGADTADDQGEVLRRALSRHFRWIAGRPTLVHTFREAQFVDPSLVTTVYTDPVVSWSDALTRAMDAGSIQRGDADALAWLLVGMAELVVLASVGWRTDAVPDADTISAFADAAAKAIGLEPAERVAR